MAGVIELHGVGKTYPGEAAPALSGASINIYTGEVTLLMGPSGSGKTTLISIMGGILRPTAGRVRIAGHEVTRYREDQLPHVRRRHIGFVFQSFNLMPTLSVRENVELALALHGLRGVRARRRASELLAQVDLAGKEDAFPADLSGGQKQRVAIARALAGEPDVVLADEPTAALDSVSGRLVMDQFKALAEKGKAVVIVSHDNRIVEYADRIIAMEDGRIASDSLPSALPLVEEHHHQLAPQLASPARRGWRARRWQLGLAALPLLAAGWVAMTLQSAPPQPKTPLATAQEVTVATGSSTAASTADSGRPRATVVAGPGRVEPLSEEVKIGAAIAGRLRLFVREGQTLAAGQTIAVVENADLAARVEQARAQVEMRQAELARIEKGAHPNEHQAAEAAVKEAAALLRHAQNEAAQRKGLLDSGDISRVEFERSLQNVEMAEIRLKKARIEEEAVRAPARVEDLARAQANLNAARAQVAEAQALAERAVIRAPFRGVLLKLYRRTGEDVAAGGDPVVSFGDTSGLRVRMDVDEADVGKIQVGDKAYCTAQAFGNRRFLGKVVSIAKQLGRKNIESGDPADKVDTRVLETLIALEGDPGLPVGLRVVAFVELK